MGCWLLSGVTLTMKRLLSFLLDCFSCSCIYPPWHVLTAPLKAIHKMSFKTTDSWLPVDLQCRSLKKHCLFYNNANVIYLQFNPNNKSLVAPSAIQTLKQGTAHQEKDIWVIWEKTSQEFDIHLSQYHSLSPLSTLSFTDKALMPSLPSTCIWVAYQCRKSF